ncbi:hypothetical protein [Saccharopolyspora hattusasensis]|uniref:hypothetical protein n=1 Tax=Saccharopolyspora hattusasensis TaxID=1128679 RepID=UPI003D9569FC
MTSTDRDTPHIAVIRRSMDAGFRFRYLPEPGSQGLAAIFAERRYGGVVENYAIRDTDEAVAARFRAEDYPNGNTIWRTNGTVEEVITALLELSAPDTSGAPSLPTAERSLPVAGMRGSAGRGGGVATAAALDGARAVIDR